MLDDIDRALKSLLLDELPSVVADIRPDDFDVSVDPPHRGTTSRFIRPTLDLFLLHVEENQQLRRAPSRRSRDGARYRDERPPVRLTCSYLVSAWATQVRDEHRLLAGAAKVFWRNPTLPRRLVEGDLPSDREIRLATVPAELEDTLDVWGVIGSDLRSSLRLEVTVPLELHVERSGGLVLDQELRIRHPRPLAGAGTVAVAGQLLRDGAPVAEATVRMAGRSATTRADGTFDLREVPSNARLARFAVRGDVFVLETERAPGELAPGERLLFELPRAEAPG